MSGGFSGSDTPSYLSSLLALLEGQDLTADLIKTLLPQSEYTDLYYPNGLLRQNSASNLLQMYYQYVEGGSYASATVDSLPEAIQNFSNSSVIDSSNWMPIYTSDGDLAMVACTKPSYSAGTLGSYVIYYNGNYYYNTSGNASLLQTNYLSDDVLKMDSLPSSWVLVE